MMRKLFAIAVVLLMAGSGSLLHAATMDFEGLPPGYISGASYTEDGFSLVAYQDVLWIAQSPSGVYYTNGTTVLITEAPGPPFSPLTFSAIDSSVFNLFSLDLSYPWYEVQWGPVPLTVTGNQVGGGVLSYSTLLEPGSGFFTVNLNWPNLTSVTFNASGNQGIDWFGLDNINANPVPEPSTMLLLGSGLLGLWGTRKKFKK